MSSPPSPPPQQPIDIPALLRFLTQTCKLPLATAISTIPLLKAAALTSSSLISAAPAAAIKKIFPEDEKRAKAVHAAAKREIKKRKVHDDDDDDAATPAGKKARRDGSTTTGGEEAAADSEARLEADLALPTLEEHFPHLDQYSSSTPSAELLTHLAATTLHTNRAPLLLTFALTLLAYTMPDQPLSSRLSLAQAVVSEGARKRARDLGIDPSGGSAEREGWGDGRPGVKVMGRMVKVMRRGVVVVDDGSASRNDEDIQAEMVEESEAKHALWALDLEAVKKANMLSSSSSKGNATADLPIYHPQGARAYLMKAFASASAATNDSSTQAPALEKAEIPAKAEANVDVDAPSATSPITPRKKIPKSSTPKSKAPKASKPPSQTQQKVANFALLLTALDILFMSWAKVLGPEELDRRAWGWYVAVRPSVEEGAAGWGGKGEVDLGRVLGLRRVFQEVESGEAIQVKVKGEEG